MQEAGAAASTTTRDTLVAGLALAAGVGAAVLVGGSDREPAPAWASAGLALLVGWAWIGSGLVAWRQRPEHRLGPVMVFIGFAWFATLLADADDPLLFTLGTALEDIYPLASCSPPPAGSSSCARASRTSTAVATERLSA